MPHAFEPFSDEDMVYMDDVKQRLFYNSLGEEQGKYFLQNLARATMGDVMKRLMLALGNSNCGKSVITKVIKAAFGRFVGTFNAENFARRGTTDDEAKSLRWMLLLAYNRIIFSNEMKTSITLDGNMIKKASSGGDEVIGRTHGKEEESFSPHFLAVVFANDTPRISPYDDAIDNRLKIINFNKEYVDNPENEFQLKIDNGIEVELLTPRFQRVLVGLLVKTYAEYVVNGEMDEPADARKAKSDWIPVEDRPFEVLMSEFKVTNNPDDFVKSKDIEHFIKDNQLDLSMAKFGKLLTRHCALIYKDKKCVVGTVPKTLGGKSVRVWTGLKRAVEEECLI